MHRIDEEKTAARAAEMLLLTVLRPTELCRSEWIEVDWNENLLIVPRKRMKVKKNRHGMPHTIPLPSRGMEILHEMRELHPGDFIFQGSRQGRSAEIKENFAAANPDAKGWPMERSSLHYLVRKLGYDRDPHALRSTFSDWAYAQRRFRVFAIEYSLDHTVHGRMPDYRTTVAGRYHRDTHLDEHRELLQLHIEIFRRVRGCVPRRLPASTPA